LSAKDVPHWQKTKTESERIENDIPTKWKSKQELLYSLCDKVDFKLKLVRRDKQGHYILIKGIIHQEDTTVLNTYASNFASPNS
jgi:hypothetical protein